LRADGAFRIGQEHAAQHHGAARPSDERAVFPDGREATGLDDRASRGFRGRSIGFVFQYHHFDPRLTAHEKC
jgi:lipoprotein-releasing system ATP-binding protein